MNEEIEQETVYEAPAPQMQVLAIVSLVLGILGLLMVIACAPVGIVMGIGAAVCGHIALSKIRTEPDRWQGRGLALAGTILGYVSLVLCVLSLLIAIFFIAARSGHVAT